MRRAGASTPPRNKTEEEEGSRKEGEQGKQRSSMGGRHGTRTSIERPPLFAASLFFLVAEPATAAASFPFCSLVFGDSFFPGFCTSVFWVTPFLLFLGALGAFLGGMAAAVAASVCVRLVCEVQLHKHENGFFFLF